MNLKNIKKDIIIGTAQLNSNYGIANKNINDQKKSIELLNYAKNNDFNSFDSAYAYKNAHKIIGNWASKKKIPLNLYTKLPKLSSLQNKNITKSFNDALKYLNTNNIAGLLLHNSRDWENNDVKSYIKKLILNKKISKFGLSIYETQEIIQDPLVKLLQVPGNIFNQNLLKSEELYNFSSKGGEVHIRSIFVQGLILMNIDTIPNQLKECKKPIIEFHNICKEIKIDPAILALACVKNIFPSAKIVIGIDHIDQLKLFNDLDNLTIEDRDILDITNFGYKNQNVLWDPRNWNI